MYLKTEGNLWQWVVLVIVNSDGAVLVEATPASCVPETQLGPPEGVVKQTPPVDDTQNQDDESVPATNPTGVAKEQGTQPSMAVSPDHNVSQCKDVKPRGDADYDYSA